MQAVTVALCLISLSSRASQDFSALNTSELTQLKSGEIGKEDHNALRTEIHSRSVSTMKTEEKVFCNPIRDQNKGRIAEHGMQARDAMQSGIKWNTDLQPYIDAHRGLGAHS